MSWYRTYRPQTFAGLHITPVRDAFLQILSSGSFSHAYLLTGPKGTGKTSGARILAKVLNCEENRKAIEQFLLKSSQATGYSQQKNSKKTVNSELSTVASLLEPCNTCASCIAITNGTSMSVLEMDAASNRGIDDIRQLRERIGLAPPDGLISVFIIDEVHMLTTEAFNALLKVLEEPPAHVVFVLATTDLQKMPATVVSRCIQIQYRKANADELTKALEGIAKAEGITIADDLLKRLATAGDGSFRDTVKLFESVSLGKKEITESDLDGVLGKSTVALISQLLNGLLKKSAPEVLSVFSELETGGMDGLALYKQVLKTLHDRMVEYAGTNDKRFVPVVALLKALVVPIDTNVPIPWMSFEVACMEWCVGSASLQGESIAPPIATPPPKPAPQVFVPPKEVVREEKKKAAVIEKKEEPEPVVSIQEQVVVPVETGPSLVDFSTVTSKWIAVLQSVKSKSVPVEGLLRVTKPVRIEGNVLICEAAYQFHKEQLEVDRNRLVVETVLESLVGAPLRIKIELGRRAIAVSKLPDSNISGKVTDDALVQAASEAFL